MSQEHALKVIHDYCDNTANKIQKHLKGDMLSQTLMLQTTLLNFQVIELIEKVINKHNNTEIRQGIKEHMLQGLIITLDDMDVPFNEQDYKKVMYFYKLYNEAKVK